MNMIKLFAIKYLNRTIDYHIFQGSRQQYMRNNFIRQKCSIQALFNKINIGRIWNPLLLANSVYGIGEHPGFKKIYKLDEEFHKRNVLDKMMCIRIIRTAEENKRLVELFIREEL